MKKLFFLIITIFLLNQFAIGNIQIKQSNFDFGPIDTVKTVKQFDGIWKGLANVTLIKELRGYVILQGKDAQSTWSAKCVIKENQLICRGEGVTNHDIPFVYESIMTFEKGILIDKWKAIFSTEKTLEGTDELKLLELD
jgi:hypothetical protein